jgi:lactoylglutathione lyase
MMRPERNLALHRQVLYHHLGTTLAKLRFLSKSPLSPPKDLPSWRHWTLFFRDPEGNIIEIYAEM